MFIELESLHRRERYQWMISSVVPRPIALVSTIGPSGVNLAPFSWFNGVSSDPPLVSLSIGTKRRGVTKDTVDNLAHTPELVIHVVTEPMLDPTVHASGEWPADVDEIALSRFTSGPSKLVAPPRVLESPIAMECRVEQIIEIGEPATSLVLARVIALDVDDRVVRDGRIDPELLRPVSRLGGDFYATLGTLLTRKRPDGGVSG